MKETLDNRVSPMWLPQMNAPQEYVFDELNKNGVNHKIVQVNPKELIPLQKLVKKIKVEYFNNLINNEQPIDPIFISADNEILDGHNRAYSFMQNPEIQKIDCIRIYLDYKDACRVLNKIQDKFDFQNSFDPSKDDVLSFNNSEENEVNQPNNTIEDNNINQTTENELLNFNEVKNNPITLKLYKSKPINNTSKTGDFLILNQKPNFNFEYELEFDNLYDIPQNELYDNETDSFLPTETLFKKWFPYVDVKKDSAKMTLTPEVFINRMINQKAKTLGYDGIKYGDKFVQIIN